LIDFEQDGFNHIMTLEFEARVVEQLKDVFATASKEIVEADNIMPFAKQSFTKMRANKAGAAGD
jgi:hypothetical protein